MTRDSSIYLKDILENIDRAGDFIGAMGLEEFSQDKKTFYAVVRCLEIIGEASKGLPEEVKKEFPQIPWRDIAGLRDKAIHSYFGINPERIWTVVKEDLPELKPVIKKALQEIKK